MSKPKLVMIEWEDSHTRDGWSSNEPDGKPVTCLSIGWLVKETKHATTLSANITSDPNFRMQRNGDITIPASAIRRVRKVK